MPQKIVVYQAVTADRFKLIIRQSDTISSLAKQIGVCDKTIKKAIKKKSIFEIDCTKVFLEKFIIIYNNKVIKNVSK